MLEALTLPVDLEVTGTAVSVRRAAEGDLAAIVRLLSDDPVSSSRGDVAATADEPLYGRALSAILSDPGNDLVVVVDAGGAVVEMIGSRPAEESSWMPLEAIERGATIASVFPELQESDLFVCGPAEWADLVVRDARAAGVKDRQIHVERFV